MPPRREPFRLRYRAMHVLVASGDPERIGVIREMVGAELIEARHDKPAQLIAFPCGTILG